MNLYIWHGDYNGVRHSIYALANNKEEAIQKAIDSIPEISKPLVRSITASYTATEYNESAAFIFTGGIALI